MDEPASHSASENEVEHSEGHEEASGGQHFEMIEIEIGDSELGFAEVVSSDLEKLKQQRVVIEGAYALLSSMKNSEEEGGARALIIICVVDVKS